MLLAFFRRLVTSGYGGLPTVCRATHRELSSQLWGGGRLRTVWGKPDCELCWCGQQPSWRGETSGLTHSLRLQGQRTDLLIIRLSCDCSSASNTRRSLGWMRWMEDGWRGITAVLGILHLASGVGSMSVSKQSTLDEILSCWKSTLPH